MKSKKYLWILFVLTLLTSMLMVNVPVTASPTVTYSIDPYITSGVAPDNDVSVNVTIDTSLNITGARIWVEIDPAVLTPGYEIFPSVMIYVTEGNFLSDWADTYNETGWEPGIAPIQYTLESDGYADISLFIKTYNALPDGHGASGNGTLVTLWFTSLNQTAHSLIDITTAQYGTPPPDAALFSVDVLTDGHYNEPPAGGDVAVTNVVPAESQAFPLWTVPINVTVLNNDVSPATFTVTAYYENATAAYEIGTQPVTSLAGGATQNVTFNWSLSSVAYGTYTIKANATLIDDTNPSNDEFVDGTVLVKMPGDVDGNREVKGFDAALFAGAWWTVEGVDEDFNPQCDFDGNGEVKGFDAALFGGNWWIEY